MLAAVSAPSSLAAELAEESGMTLVGFLRGASMNVYTARSAWPGGSGDGRMQARRPGPAASRPGSIAACAARRRIQPLRSPRRPSGAGSAR